MSINTARTDNTMTKKCGEICITIKKNTKNVYSFNCWFCDTICLQMKKFTLHMEREHVKQLDQINSIESNEIQEVDNVEIQRPKDGNNIITEIKVEFCANDDIKSESGEECLRDVSKSMGKDNLFTNFKDPLETFEDKMDNISLPLLIENNDSMEIKENQNICLEKSDVEMHTFSDEYQEDDYSDSSGENYSTDSDLKKNENLEEKPVKRKNKAVEKELTLALIEEYYKCPKLWNTSITEKCNFLRKDDLLQSITESLNAKLKMKLKLYMIKKKLNSLCKQYEKEIERQLNENQESKAENSDLWFFEKMSFLKTIFENKLKLKRKKPNHKVKPLDDNLICDLIEIYKNYNSLWDVNHLAYTVKDKRHEIMQSMLDEIKNKMNICLDAYKLEKQLHYIHKTFAKDKGLRLQCELKEQSFQPINSFFDKCEFLENHQGPFKCSSCNDIIDTYNDFQIHKSQHDGSMPFKCQECGMCFKKITNYTIHAKRHLRVFKFHCTICGKGYPFNAELDLHMRSHTGAQPYLCSVCGEGFRTAISYDNHIRRHEERFKYFCHICKKGFNHMTRLNDHVKAHLNVRDVICTVCGKGFTSRKYLNHHKRIHEGKNYSCNICGKSFAQDAGLRAHKKYHGTPIGVSSIQKEQNKYKLL